MRQDSSIPSHTSDGDLVWKQFWSFGTSLFWISIIGLSGLFSTQATDIACVDFLHINPNRSHENAIESLFSASIFIYIILLFQLLITFLLSQILQGRLLGWLYEKYDRIGLLLFILAIPISAVVSWYCYDYLVPNNPGFIFDAPEDELFHHGLTVSRYLTILGIQAAISIFSVTRFIFAEKYTRSVKALVFLALISVAVLYGAGKGARACNLIDTKSSAVSNKY